MTSSADTPAHEIAFEETCDRPDDDPHEIVEEAYEHAVDILQRDDGVTAADMRELHQMLTDATEHPEQDILVTLYAEGLKNACSHFFYPDGPYSYEPKRTPRQTLLRHVTHEIEITVE